MDFLLTNFGSICLATLQEQVLSHEALDYAQSGNVQIAAGRLRSAHGAIETMDGYAINNGLYVGSWADRPSSLTDQCHGIYVLVRIDGDGQVQVSTDPLGQYPVFYWARNQRFVISNNVHMLAAHLRSQGATLTKSVACIAFCLGYGTSFGNVASYDDVTMLRSRRRLETDHAGVLKEVIVSSQAETYLTEEPYEPIIDRCAERMCSTVRAAAQEFAGQEIVSDLTGGVDSRLVLAASLACKCERALIFHCLGDYPNPDRNVCDYLIFKYGLRPASYRASNLNEQLTLLDYVRRGVYRQFAVKLGEYDGVGRLYFPNSVKLTGYFGEFSRGFGGDALEEATPQEITRNYFRLRQPPSSYLTPEGQSLVESAFRRCVEDCQSEGLPSALLSQAVYAENRSRFHFGIATRSSHDVRPTIHPLYELDLVRAAGRLPKSLSRANKVAFDLIERLAGVHLALEPRAGSERWSGTVVPAPLQPWYSTVPSVTVSTPRLSPPADVASRGAPSPAHRHKEFETRMRAQGKPYFFGQLPEFQDYLRTQLPALGSNHDLWKLVDRRRVLDAIERDPETFEDHVQARNIMALASATMWLTDDVLPTKLDEPIALTR